MSIENTTEKLFQMSEEVWQRHSNPWSVWTRYPCLPLLCFAVWSRAWIGWMCIIPITVICLWIWLNPRVFGKPKSTNNWASKAVLGERILLKHPKSDIPSHHKTSIGILKLITFIGFLLAVSGLVFLHIWLTILGTVITILGKSWFLDLMVCLYQDLSAESKEYQSWLY